MLDLATKYLRRILSALGEQIDAGIPIVDPGTELCLPSSATNCVIFFRQMRAPSGCGSQTFLLSEFLQHQAPGYEPPQLGRKECSSTDTVIRRR